VEENKEALKIRNSNDKFIPKKVTALLFEYLFFI